MMAVKTTWSGGVNPFGLMPIGGPPVIIKAGKAKIVVNATAHDADRLVRRAGRWVGLFEMAYQCKTLEMICTRQELKAITNSARSWVARNGLNFSVVQKRDNDDGKSRVFLKGGKA